MIENIMASRIVEAIRKREEQIDPKDTRIHTITHTFKKSYNLDDVTTASIVSKIIKNIDESIKNDLDTAYRIFETSYNIVERNKARRILKRVHDKLAKAVLNEIRNHRSKTS